MDPQIAAVVGLLIVAATAMYMVRRQRGFQYIDPATALRAQVDNLSEEIGKLSVKLAYVEQEYLKSIKAEAHAGRRVVALEEEVAALEGRIAELESESGGAGYSSEVRLLHISGNPEFGQNDRMALRQAGITFRRLTNATKDSIADEIRRRRLSGEMYEYVVISAHMGQDGIMLEAEGAVVPSWWWNEHFKGVVVLFLNGCQSLDIADDLTGLVRYVISLGEDIPDKMATDFIFAFWRRIQQGLSPGNAYRAALGELPGVSEYADLRVG